MEAEHVLINYFLGVDDSVQNQKLVKRLLNTQKDDGTWGIYYGSPGELSTTVECYFALKLSGVSPDAPDMKKARDFILAHGGVEQTRVFTKFWLSLFGQYPWKGIPILPPEMMFLPNWFPINIYEFASWARTGVVPLMIVLTQRPVCSIPDSAKINELFTKNKSSSKVKQPVTFFSWKAFFIFVDKCLRLYEKFPWKPGRKRANQKVLNWIIDRTQSDGTWGGTQVGWSYPLIALKTAGYTAEDTIIKNCLDGVIKNYSYEIEGALQIEATNSPIWDTCLMITALIDSGLSIDTPILAKGIHFLLHNQIKSKGDWQVKNPHTPSAGWAFEFANDCYPDIDDVAEVIIALYRYQSQLKNPDEAIQHRYTMDVKHAI
jgi:squalene-hopene/tetraprenyl-beta-curcumene cyclase